MLRNALKMHIHLMEKGTINGIKNDVHGSFVGSIMLFM